MPRRDELDESPQAADVEAFGDATVTCPKCKSTLYDDVDLCWKCGHALRGADEAGGGRGAWVALVVVAAIVIGMVLVLLR